MFDDEKEPPGEPDHDARVQHSVSVLNQHLQLR
jgi:hypothetical protein